MTMSMKRMAQQFYQGKVDLEQMLDKLREDGHLIIQSCRGELWDVIWYTNVKRYQCYDHTLRGAVLGILDCYIKLTRWLSELDELEEWMRREREK